MKRNKLLVWSFCIMGILICVWLIRIRNQEQSAQHPPTVSAGNEQSKITAQQEQSSANATNGVENKPVVGQPRKSAFKTVEDARAAAAEALNVPIEFYGKVIDQDGIPLEGANITAHILHAYFNPGLGPATDIIKRETTSGADGRFYFGGLSGDVVAIDNVKKEGYELEPNTKRDFGYNTGERFIPDPNTPATFRMWRTNIHEQLIGGEKRFHFVPDGRPYFINFSDGTIAESGGGDLKVWVKYPGQDPSGGTNNWFSEMDVINGGLLEETDAYSSMFSAPADGYTPVFQHNGWIRDIQSGSTGTRRFYVTLKNGQEYGRITIELIAPYNRQIPGLIRLSYAINPSGSRILR